MRDHAMDEDPLFSVRLGCPICFMWQRRAEVAIAHIQALLDVEWIRGAIDDKCAWCGGLYHFDGHDVDCPRQVAVRWLEENGG